ncbi:hypothetical protein [Streptomyces globisporus]|uniref:aromatic-ring hydroxylase C-terminal domain-containing protein n=1 Tax=Streptomyces globisporus TaxID=1908 RepID=UPI00131CC9A0|nr:hypothetical protein [Streptomyces globisporus]
MIRGDGTGSGGIDEPRLAASKGRGCRQLGRPVDVVTARSADRHPPASAVLVRADGYLVWATDGTSGRSTYDSPHEALT